MRTDKDQADGLGIEATVSYLVTSLRLRDQTIPSSQVHNCSRGMRQTVRAMTLKPDQWIPPIGVALVVLLLGAIVSRFDTHTATLVITCAVVVALFLAGLLGVYTWNRSNYYYYFFLRRMGPALASVVVLAFASYRLYILANNPIASAPLPFNRGADFLLYVFCFAIAFVVLIWSALRLRMLSFQKEIKHGEAQVYLKYNRKLDRKRDCHDHGNRVFELTFKVVEPIRRLRVSFVAIETLQPGGSRKRTQIVWTSLGLWPAKTLGLNLTPTAEKSLFDPLRVDEWIDRWDVHDGQVLYAFVDDAGTGDSFTPDTVFRVVVYFHQGGYIKHEIQLPVGGATGNQIP